MLENGLGFPERLPLSLASMKAKALKLVPSAPDTPAPAPPCRLVATVKPFAALRPKPELAQKICELPYDVMSSEEAHEMAGWNPLSFLHVSKPEKTQRIPASHFVRFLRRHHVVRQFADFLREFRFGSQRGEGFDRGHATGKYAGRQTNARSN